DVVDGETGAAQRLLRRLDRAEAHDLGGEAGDTGGDDPGQRGQAELAGLAVAHDDQRGGAVVERAAVAGGDQPVGAEDRLQTGDALHGDPGARTVVLGDHGAVRRRDGSDLALPEAVLDGLLGEVLRADAELV